MAGYTQFPREKTMRSDKMQRWPQDFKNPRPSLYFHTKIVNPVPPLPLYGTRSIEYRSIHQFRFGRIKGEATRESGHQSDPENLFAFGEDITEDDHLFPEIFPVDLSALIKPQLIRVAATCRNRNLELRIGSILLTDHFHFERSGHTFRQHRYRYSVLQEPGTHLITFAFFGDRIGNLLLPEQAIRKRGRHLLCGRKPAYRHPPSPYMGNAIPPFLQHTG